MSESSQIQPNPPESPKRQSKFQGKYQVSLSRMELRVILTGLCLHIARLEKALAEAGGEHYLIEHDLKFTQELHTHLLSTAELDSKWQDQEKFGYD